MVYLLDTNVLFNAGATYFALDIVPRFWDWLASEGAAGNVKIPPEIAAEVTVGKRDPIASWLTQKDVWDALVLTDDADVGAVRYVLNNGYGPNLDDVVLAKFKADPFLVAHGYAQPGRTVVTRERSEPNRDPQNRKIPDACDRCSVPCITVFQFFRAAGFLVR